MALKALLCVLLLNDCHSVLAPPTHNIRIPTDGQSPPTAQNINPRRNVLLGPLSESDLFAETPSRVIPDDQQYLLSFPYFTENAVDFTTTVTVFQEEPTTITVTAVPSTVTEIVTVIESASSAPLPSPTTSPPESGPELGQAKAIWMSPKIFTDLSSFKVSKAPGGGKNLKFVTGIPALAGGIASSSAKKGSSESASAQWDDGTSALQILYPENSIDPAQKPQGGVEFYASPLDFSDSRNVSFEYSVFFPDDFDWVLGGKLPGLYGGHTGCSGGNAALDCFSTRLMWRQEGAGELYLYAPKDKQTDALCSDPGSTCDQEYGLSIGRGSFTWASGKWTTVRQTICLNTPGKQDGAFTLDVNGEKVIDRNDVFYREDLGDDKSGPTRITHTPTRTSKNKHNSPTSTDDSGLLGPIISGIDGILGNLGIQDERAELNKVSQAFATSVNVVSTESSFVLSPGQTASSPEESSPTAVIVEGNRFSDIRSESEEVKLIGIFFSTFFGGHEKKYATPRDQYIWLKDFVLVDNA